MQKARRILLGSGFGVRAGLGGTAAQPIATPVIEIMSFD